jgi:hypothetical protein
MFLCIFLVSNEYYLYNPHCRMWRCICGGVMREPRPSCAHVVISYHLFTHTPISSSFIVDFLNNYAIMDRVQAFGKNFR